MLYVSGNDIKLTRGDTAFFRIPIMNSDNEEYVMAAGDTLTLSAKKRVTDTEYVLQKTVVGSNTIHIIPEDTNSLKFGVYQYDIQLTTEAGDVFTLIPVSTFEIMQEVTCS